MFRNIVLIKVDLLHCDMRVSKIFDDNFAKRPSLLSL